MMKSRYGRQPVYELLLRERWTFAAAARRTGIPYGHFLNCIRGKTVPSAEARRKLSKLLSRRVDQLFTREILARTHSPVPIDRANTPSHGPSADLFVARGQGGGRRATG